MTNVPDPRTPEPRDASPAEQGKRELAEIGQEGAGSKYAKHLEELNPKGTVAGAPKNTATNDPRLTPVQTPLAEPSKGQQARSQANRTARGTSTGVVTGNVASRPKGKGLDTKNVKTALKRQQKGMGLPGDENGVNAHAMSMYNRDVEIATRENKAVNGIKPGTLPATESAHIHGTQHQRMAQVIDFYGHPEETIKNLGAGSGATAGIKFNTLHSAMVEHKKSQQVVSADTAGATHWEHPRTKEHHLIAANHPDMPKEFTKRAGETQTVSIGGSGKIVMNDPVTEGWHPMKLHGTSDVVMRQHTAPAGTPLVDHLRSSIAGSGSSTSVSSRKRSADKATGLAHDMQRTGPMGNLPGNNYVNYGVTGYVEHPVGKDGKKPAATPILKPKDYPKAPAGKPVSNVVEAATPKTKKATVYPYERGVVVRQGSGTGMTRDQLAASSRSERSRKTAKNFSQKPPAQQLTLPGMESVGRDVKVPAVSTPEYVTHQGPLESWHTKGSTEIPLGKKEPMLSPTIKRKTGKANTIIAGSTSATGTESARYSRMRAEAQLTAAHPVEDHSVPEGQMHFPGMGISRQFAGGNWIEAKNLPEKTRELQDKADTGGVPSSTIDFAPEKRPAPKPRDTRSHKNKKR